MLLFPLGLFATNIAMKFYFEGSDKMEVSVCPSLAPNLYKSRSGSSTRLSSTSLGVCFIKGLTFFVKLTSDFTLNFSLDIGRHECSLG